MIYFDTSALMKLVHPEPETAALRRYLHARRAIPKFTATLTFAELPRAVRRANHDPSGRVRDREVMDAEIEQSRTLLQTLRLVEVTRALLSDSAMIDGSLLRTLDAIHLTAATRLTVGLTAFVTYDKRLTEAAREAGLPVTVPA